MTQKEFESLTHRLVRSEDYQIIENLYLVAGEMDKREFCKEFKAMCAYDGANNYIQLRQCLKEISKFIDEIEAQAISHKKEMKQRNDDLVDILIGKAHAHNDTDLYREATKLVGQWQVVKRTIEMDLPLWDEDKEYICALLDERGKKEI